MADPGPEGCKKMAGSALVLNMLSLNAPFELQGYKAAD